ASVEKDFENYFEKAQKASATIPNVRGMSGMDAVSLLENLGLKVEFSGSGKVKSQSLKAGQKLSKNQKIILQLS
ncbi:PASTA domain-containing protein, partial [Leeuwenhoekiella blandensis]